MSAVSSTLSTVRARLCPHTNRLPPLSGKLGVAFRQTETVRKNAREFPWSGFLYPHFGAPMSAKRPARGRYSMEVSRMCVRARTAGTGHSLATTVLPITHGNRRIVADTKPHCSPKRISIRASGKASISQHIFVFSISMPSCRRYTSPTRHRCRWPDRCRARD